MRRPFGPEDRLAGLVCHHGYRRTDLVNPMAALVPPFSGNRSASEAIYSGVEITTCAPRSLGNRWGPLWSELCVVFPFELAPFLSHSRTRVFFGLNGRVGRNAISNHGGFFDRRRSSGRPPHRARAFSSSGSQGFSRRWADRNCNPATHGFVLERRMGAHRVISQLLGFWLLRL